MPWWLVPVRARTAVLVKRRRRRRLTHANDNTRAHCTTTGARARTENAMRSQKDGCGASALLSRRQQYFQNGTTVALSGLCTAATTTTAIGSGRRQRPRITTYRRRPLVSEGSRSVNGESTYYTAVTAAAAVTQPVRTATPPVERVVVVDATAAADIIMFRMCVRVRTASHKKTTMILLLSRRHCSTTGSSAERS